MVFVTALQCPASINKYGHELKPDVIENPTDSQFRPLALAARLLRLAIIVFLLSYFATKSKAVFRYKLLRPHQTTAKATATATSTSTSTTTTTM